MTDRLWASLGIPYTTIRSVEDIGSCERQQLPLVEFVHECTMIIGTTDGQTDLHDEANSRFSQFCVSA